jgi:rod shape-determining protein MreD
MQIVLNLLIILIAFILQNTVGVYFKLGPVSPDITLIALVSIAFIESQLSSIYSGFLAGFLKDLVSLRGFGVNTLTHTLLGYLAGGLDSSLVSNILFLIPVVFIITLVSQFFYVGIAFLVGYQVDYLFWQYAFIVAFYNGLISPFIYLPIKIFYQKFTLKQKVMGIEDGQKKA